MEKKLTVAIKKIVGQVNPKEGKWSGVLTFEPEDQKQEKTRGRLFAVLDLTGSTALDLVHFGRLALETLKDEYYASEETSPLKSLEGAIHKAKHRLVELAFGPEGAVPDSALNYNFAAAVLWGTVLYLAKFGASGLYLRRGGRIEELGEPKDEKIFSASGMVQSGDVVVLGSSDFKRTFSVGELPGALDKLESLASDLGNPAGISALVVRLELEAVPGEEEEVVIAPVAEKEPGFKRLLKKLSSLFPKKILLLIPSLLFLAATAFTIDKRRTDFREAEADRLVQQAEQTLADAQQYVDLNNSRARELLLEAKDDFAAAEEVGGGVLGLSERMEEIDTLLDQVNKVKRVKLEKVEETTINFDPLSELDSPPEVDESVVDTGTYFGNAYFLVPSENQILKSVPVESGEYSVAKYWVTAENPPLTDAVAMAIDGFIYVLKSDGSVLKFEKGELVFDFGLKDLDKPLADPRAIFTTIDSEHLYILDAGNKRIVVINKSGFYESQYVYEGLTDPTDLFVDEAAGATYLLDGTKVFRIGM